MKFLILGASGMAGHTIAIYLSEQGHDVTGLCRSAQFSLPYFNSVVGDAFDRESLERIIGEGSYDVIVNAIGILNADAEEQKDRSAYLNAYFPHCLARVVSGTKTRVFHMSTDCVFAGNTGPYHEKSIPDGTSFYDRSKALGELNDQHNLTFRNSIVGPDLNARGIGLLNWFMAQQGPIKGYTKAIWTGLTTLELSKAMEFFAQHRTTGLMNMVPMNSISKYNLLQLFNRYLRNGSISIEPSDDLILDKTLIRGNEGCVYTPASYEKQVREISAWIHKHHELYSHYKKKLAK